MSARFSFCIFFPARRLIRPRLLFQCVVCLPLFDTEKASGKNAFRGAAKQLKNQTTNNTRIAHKPARDLQKTSKKDCSQANSTVRNPVEKQFK